jgi:SAM-dependent methyltransferase
VTSPERCVWCGAPFDARATRLGGRIRCGTCGAATTDPWPTPAALEAAYGDWYRPASGRRFAGGLGDALLKRTRATLARRIDETAPPGRVLDVGAGDGTLLDALARRGRVGLGLERDARRDDMGDASIAEVNGEWAAIVFWHSLEHLPEPGDAIRHAARLLAPGGVLFVAVPDAGSPQARAFGDDWLHLDLPRHLVHLPAPTLLAGLSRAGLEVSRVSPVRGGQVVVGWLDGLVGCLPGGLDLYAAIRQPAAQEERLSPGTRAATVAAGTALLPLAAALGALEVASGRAGTVYVEARAPA